MNPHLKLKIDVEADIYNAKWFIQNGKLVDWFLPNELLYLIESKLSSKEKNEIITKYTTEKYKIEEEEIRANVKNIENEWLKIEDTFYGFTDKLFKGHPWPKGEYIGYASVFLIFPRNIQEKMFYFPYTFKYWNPIIAIAHEMLHFIFFDYIKTRYGINEDDEVKGMDPQYVWRVSETFNTVIENWNPYAIIFNKDNKAEPYPECEEMYEIMKKQWEENQDVELLLDKWLCDKKF